ncbi:MAG: ferredoxin--NADP reductase [Marinobacter sp.]
MRVLTRQALAELDGLNGRQAACQDASLASTLGTIGQRKSAQTRRLLDWLGRHDTPAPVDHGAEPWQAKTPQQPRTPEHSRQGSQGGEAPGAEAPSPSSRGSVAVIERRDVTPELIVFRVTRPEDFRFSPGQSVKVGLGGVRRSYSIVSAPHEPFLEFFVELVPGGQMSERLRKLQPGDALSIGSAKSGLHFDGQVRNHLMIATVTGINPFLSMVRDYQHRAGQGHRILLMHGASYLDEFGYREELEQLASAHPEWLTYLPTVSRPDEPRNGGWSGRKGRVDTLVDAIIDEYSLDPQDTLVYACGHDGMLESVAGQVQSRGFRLETESYD